MNSKKLLSFQNHRTLRIFSAAVIDQEEEPRGPGPSSVFFERHRFHTQILNNKRQNCMECKLNDPPHAPLSPDKDESSVIFGSEKDH